MDCFQERNYLATEWVPGVVLFMEEYNNPTKLASHSSWLHFIIRRRPTLVRRWLVLLRIRATISSLYSLQDLLMQGASYLLLTWLSRKQIKLLFYLHNSRARVQKLNLGTPQISTHVKNFPKAVWKMMLTTPALWLFQTRSLSTPQNFRKSLMFPICAGLPW